MTYITAIERFAIEKGKQEGKQEAKQEWKQKGKQEGMAMMLLKQSKLKFGPAPEWVETKVNQASVYQLELWTERILTASSVDDLFAPHLDS